MSTLTLLSVAHPQPPELGRVPWVRGYDAAVDVSKRTGRPLLVLFDEVPGCSTVNAYGADTLSDAVVVDASALFVPVFVSNNESGGADRKVLERFGEPTWNNPVLRVVDVGGGGEERTLARITHESGTAGLLGAMARTLGARAPEWLRLIANGGGESTAASGTVTKTFSCACFWEGEAALGGVDGVVTTEAGFVGGREAVRVRVDKARAAALEEAARAAGLASVDGTFRGAGGDDDKHALARSRYAPLASKLTPAQRTRVNAAIARGEDPLPLLAPSQRALLR